MLGCDVEYAVAYGSDQAGGNLLIASTRQIGERHLIQALDVVSTPVQYALVLVSAAFANEVGGGEFQQEGVAVEGDAAHAAPGASRIVGGSEPELPSSGKGRKSRKALFALIANVVEVMPLAQNMGLGRTKLVDKVTCLARMYHLTWARRSEVQSALKLISRNCFQAGSTQVES